MQKKSSVSSRGTCASLAGRRSIAPEDPDRRDYEAIRKAFLSEGLAGVEEDPRWARYCRLGIAGLVGLQEVAPEDGYRFHAAPARQPRWSQEADGPGLLDVFRFLVRNSTLVSVKTDRLAR